jgi:hypothetical protein
MSDIFLSYASEDRERIMSLVRALEATGWSVFWDTTIPPGKTWRKVIGTEARDCRSMVVCWSKMSVHSDWVLEEAETARRRHVLFPVLIDKVEPPLGFSEIEAADLICWDGSLESPAYLRLVKALAACLGTPPPRVEAARPKAEAQRQKEEETRRPDAEAVELQRLEGAGLRQQEQQQQATDEGGCGAEEAQNPREVEEVQSDSLQTEAERKAGKWGEQQQAEPKHRVEEPIRREPDGKLQEEKVTRWIGRHWMLVAALAVAGIVALLFVLLQAGYTALLFALLVVTGVVAEWFELLRPNPKALTVTLTPKDRTSIELESVIVSGVANQDLNTVQVRNQDASVSGREFSAQVRLVTGSNDLPIVLTDRSGNRKLISYSLHRVALSKHLPGAYLKMNVRKGDPILGATIDKLPDGRNEV